MFLKKYDFLNLKDRNVNNLKVAEVGGAGSSREQDNMQLFQEKLLNGRVPPLTISGKSKVVNQTPRSNAYATRIPHYQQQETSLEHLEYLEHLETTLQGLLVQEQAERQAERGQEIVTARMTQPSIQADCLLSEKVAIVPNATTSPKPGGLGASTNSVNTSFSGR